MLEEQHLTRIHSISLRIGVMQGYETKWMQHYFDRLAKGTPAEGASLLVEAVPIRFRCRDCGREFEFDAYGTDDCSCPACHGFSYDMISGKEFLIEQMEAS
jgi:hydrogenase nickel incorporation protein HypA/HybF